MLFRSVFLRMGEENFQQLFRTISVGRLRTYQLFDRVKARFHLSKLNSEAIKKAAPRIWARIGEKEEDFATDVAQTILVSHLDMIIAILDHLGIPHEQGFFTKDEGIGEYLKDGWRESIWEKFKDSFPRVALIFYINHLSVEVLKSEELFEPKAA